MSFCVISESSPGDSRATAPDMTAAAFGAVVEVAFGSNLHRHLGRSGSTQSVERESEEPRVIRSGLCMVAEISVAAPEALSALSPPP